MHGLTQYIVLHKSVRDQPGVCACQAAHAAGESVIGGPAPSDTSVCALMAESSQELMDLSVTLSAFDIPHVLICEPDPPYNGAAVALGVAPLPRERVKPYMAKFKVLR